MREPRVGMRRRDFRSAFMGRLTIDRRRFRRFAAGFSSVISGFLTRDMKVFQSQWSVARGWWREAGLGRRDLVLVAFASHSPLALAAAFKYDLRRPLEEVRVLTSQPVGAGLMS